MTRLLPLLLLAACADTTQPDEVNEGELITTVTLVFTSSSSAPIEARWTDLEGDGDPIVDPITLTEGVYYDLSIGFVNELEDPPEDIGAEVAREGTEHQVFLTGTGITSEATGPQPDAVLQLTTADLDTAEQPLGLVHSGLALKPGTAELVVTLRHLPDEDGTPVKTDSLADEVAAGGFASIPGDTDASVIFAVEIAP